VATRHFRDASGGVDVRAVCAEFPIAATAYITARIEPTDAEALTELARGEQHSLSAELRACVRAWIEEAPRRARAKRFARMSDDELERHLADADPALATQVRNDERSGSVRSAVPTPPIGATDHARSG